MKTNAVRWAALLCLIVPLLPAFCADYSTYENGEWQELALIPESDPADYWYHVWHSKNYPGAGDTITVTNSVSSTNDTTIDTWNMIGGDLAIGGYTFTPTSGGNWQGGSFLGTLNNSSTILLSGSNVKRLRNYGVINNHGTFRQTAGEFSLWGNLNTAYFYNYSNGTYDIESDGTNITCASGYFYNYGLIEKSAGLGTSYIRAPVHGFAQVVDVETGTLVLGGGGISTNGGTFNVAVGATLDLTGGSNPGYNGTYDGSVGGRVGWNSGTLGDLDVGLNATFQFTNGLVWGGGKFRGYLRNSQLMTLDGTGNKENFISTFDNYGAVRQTNTGPLYLNKFNNTCYFLNREGALYDIQSDSTNIIGSSLDDSTDAFYNYGTVRKSGGDGTSIIAATFCNLGGTVDVRRGTLILAGGGISSNGGTFNVAEGAVLDITGGKTPRYNGTYTGTGGGIVTWNSGSINPDSSLTFNFTNGLVWGGGRFWAYVRNDGLMTLDGTGTKENFISWLDNYGTIRQTNTGSLYLNKYNNSCQLHNRAGALYDILSDGTNITCSSANDTTDAFYNYGTFRKSGGDGTSSILAAFCNVGGTVDVQRGTLILGSGGISSNGIFDVAAGAELDLTGGNNPVFIGVYSGHGLGRVGWSSGRIGYNGCGMNATFQFTNGLVWGGGIFQGYLRNDGLVLLDGTGNKENFISTFDNYGAVRQTNTGPLYLNKFNNTCYFLNREGALYDIQSDGTNITCSSVDDQTDAFYNYGTLRKSGGDGISYFNAGLCTCGGTVDVQRGTLILGSGGVYSNGYFHAAAGATVDLAGTSSPLWYGTLGGGGEGAIQWSGGWIGDGSAATLNFTNGLHWTGGTLRGYLANTGVILLEGSGAKNPEYYSTIDNFGVIRALGDGPLRLAGSPNTATLNNQPGALFEIGCDGTNISGVTFSGRFYNYGSFVKTNGTGLSLVQCSFFNGGTVDVQRGTQQFNEFFHTGAVIRLSGGNIALPSATLRGGFVEGTGTIVEAGTLTSAARVSPGFSVGTLTISGAYAQAAAGVLDMEIGGAEAGTDYDQLCVSGSTTLGGTVAVSLINGFIPTMGQSFTLLTRGSGSGSFAALNMPSLASGLQWRPVYTTTAFSVEIVGTVQFGAASTTVMENSGTITVQVNRAGSSAGTLSVPYGTLSGTARAGYEFVAATGTIDFADGSTNAVITVSVIDNAYRDLNKTFSVQLGAPAGFWQVASPGNFAVRIVDDEILTPATLPFSEPFTSGTQAAYWTWYMTGAGRILQTTNNGPFSPDWHMTADSVSNGVYSLNEAILSANLAGHTNVWLRFRHKEFSDTDNSMPASFTNHIDADGVAVSVDGANWVRVQGLVASNGISASYRQFAVALDPCLGGAGYATNSQLKFQQYGRYPISSSGFAFDDIEIFELAGTVQWTTNAMSVTENDGAITLAVQRTSNEGSASVTYATVDGSARAGLEYAATTGIVSFAEGITNGSITVAILDNAFANDTRTFQVALGEATGPYVLGTLTNVVVTITDNEARASSSLPFYEGFESGAPSNGWYAYSTASGRIQISSNNGPRSQYHLTLDSATNGTWSLNEAVLTMNLAGQTNVWLSFFQKEFSDSDNAMATGFAGHANADGVAISTNGTNWYRLVSLTGATSGSAYVQFFISLDSVAISNGLTFNDAVQIKFQQYDRYSIGSAGFAFDDIRVFKPDGFVSLASNAFTISENGGAVTVCVMRTSGVGDLPVHYRTQNGTARAGFEYTVATGTLVLAAGISNNNVAVPVVDNVFVNPDSAFSLSIDEINGWYLPTDPVTAAITILENESASVASIPFADGFESGIFSNCWSLFSSGAGRLRIVTSNSPYAGTAHLVLDSSASNTWSLNEAVLSVDLAGRTNIWLKYYQREFGDSDQAMGASFTNHAYVDGIAMSTNGTNWIRITSLTGSASTTNDQQGLFQLDALAASSGLTLGDHVQIKFQQYGSLPSSFGGFVFDDISIFESSGSIQFSTDLFMGYESVGSATVTVARTTAAGSMSVSYYTADGSALAGADYLATTGTVFFAAGETQKTVAVPVFSDALVEGPEWFAVLLRDYAGGTPGTPTTAATLIGDYESSMLLGADFSGGLPAGWTVTTNGATSAYWRFDDPGVRGNLTGGNGTFAVADSDNAGSMAMDTELRSPILAFTHVATAHLQFKTDFYRWSDEICSVDVSLNGSSGPWTSVWLRAGTSYRGPATATLNLSSLVLNQTNVMIRFHYYNANYEYWWQVDDVMMLVEPDVDNDGLPDWWESHYSLTATSLVAGADDDGDGMDNLKEFFSATDPTNEWSFLGLRGMNWVSGTGTLVRWSTVTNKTYRLERGSNLFAGTVSIVQSNIVATAPTNAMIDTNAMGGALFYRIVVEP